MRIRDRAARWTLAAVVAGSLSFGVSQAVAAPAARSEARCIQDFCRANCLAKGALGGGCNSRGLCVCYWD